MLKPGQKVLWFRLLNLWFRDCFIYIFLVQNLILSQFCLKHKIIKSQIFHESLTLKVIEGNWKFSWFFLFLWYCLLNGNLDLSFYGQLLSLFLYIHIINCLDEKKGRKNWLRKEKTKYVAFLNLSYHLVDNFICYNICIIIKCK